MDVPRRIKELEKRVNELEKRLNLIETGSMNKTRTVDIHLQNLNDEQKRESLKYRPGTA